VANEISMKLEHENHKFAIFKKIRTELLNH
jgi:hypothetical protein